MPEWVPINWGLIKSPINWATILLMVVIFGIAVDVFLVFWAPKQTGDI